MVGRSNVGKSSLINAVLKRKGVARVSQTPGKTQAVQFYLINERSYLVDLPGYGYAKVPRDMRNSWGTLVRSYLESADALRLIFLLLDVRRDPAADDLQMIDWMNAAGVPYRVVLTKSDKLSNNQLVKSVRDVAGALGIESSALIPFSAVTKKNVDELRREIVARLSANPA